jgi:hypothetical protein
MLLLGVVVSAMAVTASASTMQIIVNAWTPQGDLNNIDPWAPDALVYFDVAIATSADNAGVATIVYNVIGDSTNPLSPMTEANSGWSNNGIQMLSNVKDPMYTSMSNSTMPGYKAGWGFDTAGLPTGGNVTTQPGSILGAGIAANLVWTADQNPLYPGLQPMVRLGVGQGTYTFPTDDKVAGGHTGGFGQDLSNAANIVDGDGHWVFQQNVIDVSGWAKPGTYNFDVNLTSGAVFDPTLDYTQDMGGGFRVNVLPQDFINDSFSFTLIPEPATLGLLLLGGLSMIRRRR